MSDPRPPLPNFMRALLGSRILDAGAAAGLVTIVGKQAFDMTSSNFTLGLLGLVEFFPTLALAPFAGSIADRFDRRVVAGVTTSIFAAICVALFFYVRTDPTAMGPIYGLMGLFGTVRAFQRPAVRALPIDLAPEGVVERVVALSSASWQAGTIVGPVIAGFVFTAAIELPYLVLGAMFGASVLALFGTPPTGVSRLSSRPGGRQAISDAVEGLRFIRGAPVVGGAIVLDLFAVLLGGAVALLPAIAEERLGVGAVGLGWLRASIGIGASSVTLVLAVRPVARRVGVVLLGSIAIFGVATIVLGLTTNYVVALVALAVIGGSDSVSVFIRNVLVPLATPEDMRGRVLALESVFIGGSNELGAFESGVTAALLGLAPAVVFGGAGTLVVVAGFWFLFPVMRHIDRFADARVAPSPAQG